MRLAPAILVALAAMLALAPRSAQAGCSSRVHPGEHPRAIGLAALDELVEDDAPLPGRIPPCSGPMCSDGPGAPMAPVPVAPDVWRELWCDASATCRRDRTGRPVAPRAGPPAVPSPAPAGVERPPRRPAA